MTINRLFHKLILLLNSIIIFIKEFTLALILLSIILECLLQSRLCGHGEVGLLGVLASRGLHVRTAKHR